MSRQQQRTCYTRERGREEARERGREEARGRGREKARERGKEEARERGREAERTCSTLPTACCWTDGSKGDGGGSEFAGGATTELSDLPSASTWLGCLAPPPPSSPPFPPSPAPMQSSAGASEGAAKGITLSTRL